MKITTSTAEIEKNLKPESTLKEIMKFLKSRQKADSPVVLHRNKTRLYLAQLYFNYKQIKFGNVFSVPSNFDYLDELSILRQLFNELNKIVNEDKALSNELQFEFMLDTLVIGCRTSKVKFLPPVNWYTFISSLLKSRHGSRHETKILELTMLQFSKSNSAYSLIKNFLVDTNYLYHLKVILKSLVFDRLWKIKFIFNFLVRKSAPVFQLFQRNRL